MLRSAHCFINTYPGRKLVDGSKDSKKMRIVDSRRIKLFALTLFATTSLSACGSEATSSYDDISESEAKSAMTEDFAVPIYPDSTLFESKRSDGGSLTITGSFHSPDACPDISDWYSRRLRMQNWVVTGIEKADSSCEVVANKGKEECKLHATNNGSRSTIIIRYSRPK